MLYQLSYMQTEFVCMTGLEPATREFEVIRLYGTAHIVVKERQRAMITVALMGFEPTGCDYLATYHGEVFHRNGISG